MQSLAIPILFGLLVGAIIVGTWLALRFPDDFPKLADLERARPQRPARRLRFRRR